MHISWLVSGVLCATGALAQTSGYCCTSNSQNQVVDHPDQTKACCTGNFDGTECWVANLDWLTTCCRNRGSGMCSF
ncbi:hypothetical protein CDEST_06087 [Colletotrichum destructivum]|uniref:Uncharacterized protein n=1 Tax=Colletotrichum destructivum TaxID=34406 RepID=A0AAX4IDP5_9PEZI|nr:hypothetical protein CDEST_06087 [Colletotrichum destructivum]